jgi:penicillin amidase
MKRVWKILAIVGIVLVVLAVAATGVGVYTVRQSFPQVSGDLPVPGLNDRVDVYFTADGVPHVYASTTHDLFFAQGYLHARDRFYQMDFWRHQTAGRLSELYGSATLEEDRFLRTVGWARLAEAEYEQADDATKGMLDAYSAGVNAYLAERPANQISLEYTLLGLTGLSNYTPEPWTSAHTLAWAKAMAWDLGGNLDEEIRRALLNRQLGPEKTSQVILPYPDYHPVILPDPALGEVDLESLRAGLAGVDALLGARFDGIGSNNWVIAGSRTTTGMPLLANDPHLGIQIPSIWYEIGLHCLDVTPDCQYDVAGFSFAGAPGVIIGHNRRIAWGFTNVNPDVQDLFIERINPQNANQYEVNGEWVDMAVTREVITIKGGGSESLTIRSTRHGPLITDVYGLKDFANEAGLRSGPKYGLALRWTALEPIFTFRAILGVNRAQNFDEFRAALQDFAAPSQNMIYADVDGNIGYQMPGNVPIRKNGDGTLPVPGWTDDYEWTGYIPFEKLPASYNPPSGYIATANNAVVGPDYPYLLTTDWDPGYRAQRIVDMIEAQQQISPEYIQQMQGDDLNLSAPRILPYLFALGFDDPKLNAALEQLRGWDYQLRIDSQPAAIYMGFFNALVADTFYDDLPSDYWLNGGPYSWQMFETLLNDPASPWWDQSGTPAVEQRDDILRRAFTEGYAALAQRLGPNSARWTWGRLHTSTFVNATLGQSGIAPIEALFNRGPYPTAGGTSIVNATSYNLSLDDRGTGDPYAVNSLPSMRMIVDLGNLDASLTMHTTGQSGHAFHPHYIDLAKRWSRIEYHPMLWSQDAILAQSKSHLTLLP